MKAENIIMIILLPSLIFLTHAFAYEEPIPDTPMIEEGMRTYYMQQENPNGTISYIGFNKEGDLEVCVRGVLYQSLLEVHDLKLRRVFQGEVK